MKQYNVFLWVIVLLSMTLGFLIGSNQQVVQNVTRGKNSGNYKLNQFINYLDRYYVDRIDTDSLATSIIQSIVDELDPHSFYISPKELERIAENMQGNFVGIGVSFFMVQDTVNVVRVLEGGPSKKAGLLAGDRILVADNDTLFGKQLTSENIVNRLRGEKRSPVVLEIYRPSTQTNLSFPLRRGAVPIRSVNHYLLASQVGYIKVNRFGETTSNEFKQALTSLKAQGMIQLVLDLRDNPGGYLDAAEEISDTFLSEGQAIVMIESNKGTRETTYATSGGEFESGQVYVLINGDSASASEVVAGALQDNDRAWIIGQRSFGKGLVQQQMPIGSQEAVRLTTARYYTPTGRSIQRPFEEDKKAYFDEINKRFETGELADKSKIPRNDSLAFKTPKGRTVYGGGGIVPDIYLSNNATIDQEWSNYILRSNLINHFVFTELDKRRSEFMNIERSAFIASELNDKEKWIEALKGYIDTQGVPLVLEDTQFAIVAIKAYLALQLFDESARLEVLHQQDNFVREALHQIDKKPLD